MDRYERLAHIAIVIENLIRDCGRRTDITITSQRLTDETIHDLGLQQVCSPYW